ncbi:MAG: LamG domain-containing protein [Lentisphaerae bacterium]|nr:LamG domain-containing protein [Lentisphaerota bacterium]
MLGVACSWFSEGRFFNGALDDFRIYARALSSEEVAEVKAVPAL